MLKIFYLSISKLLTPYYSTATDHNHDLRHTTLRLPMTKENIMYNAQNINI